MLRYMRDSRFFLMVLGFFSVFVIVEKILLLIRSSSLHTSGSEVAIFLGSTDGALALDAQAVTSGALWNAVGVLQYETYKFGMFADILFAALGTTVVFLLCLIGFQYREEGGLSEAGWFGLKWIPSIIWTMFFVSAGAELLSHMTMPIIEIGNVNFEIPPNVASLIENYVEAPFTLSTTTVVFLALTAPIAEIFLRIVRENELTV